MAYISKNFYCHQFIDEEIMTHDLSNLPQVRKVTDKVGVGFVPRMSSRVLQLQHYIQKRGSQNLLCIRFTGAVF